jgi:Ribbon-helix-helix protein, copG family
MPRKSTYSPTCTINFQTDERTRDALHAAARRQERSASAIIRLAIRAWLDEQAASSAAAQQHDERELAARGAPCGS